MAPGEPRLAWNGYLRYSARAHPPPAVPFNANTTHRRFRMRIHLALITILLLAVLSGCAGQPQRSGQQSGAAKGAPGAEPAEPAKPPEPASPVPPEVLYDVFAGEIAGQNEDYTAAARYYLSAARLSADPAIAERATQVALYASEYDVAQSAVARLLELSPGSERAHRTAVSLALYRGDRDTAMRHLERVLALANPPGKGWRDVAQLLARSPDQALALELMGNLVDAHSDQVRAWKARSELASHFGKLPEALDYASKALSIDPDWAEGLAWRGRLKLSDADYEGAARDLENALELDPDNTNARLNYAEALRRQGDYKHAQAELAKLPQDPDLVKTRASLALEAEDWSLARNLYQQLLDDPDYTQEAYFFLGQLAELQERYPDALEWYAKVTGETYRLQARIREALVLAHQKRLDESLELLDSLASEGSDAEVEAILARGQILADAGKVEQAFKAYDNGLERLPDNDRLRYARALLAADQGRLDMAEKDLRSLIKQNPNDPQALNALGYTLAEQTDRYQEAFELISRAYKLAPDDAAVEDSMGWVKYRLGENQEALEHLRRALDLQFDPEIAAHLGEVLWVTGSHDQAMKVWNKAIKKNPDGADEVRKTMERLVP